MYFFWIHCRACIGFIALRTTLAHVETDQNCVAGAMNYLNEHNVNYTFVMIYGTTTPKQKATIMAKAAVDIELYKDLWTWFINNNWCEESSASPISNDVRALTPSII